jgi:hypothetical protein
MVIPNMFNLLFPIFNLQFLEDSWITC